MGQQCCKKLHSNVGFENADLNMFCRPLPRQWSSQGYGNKVHYPWKRRLATIRCRRRSILPGLLCIPNIRLWSKDLTSTRATRARGEGPRTSSFQLFVHRKICFGPWVHIDSERWLLRIRVPGAMERSWRPHNGNCTAGLLHYICASSETVFKPRVTLCNDVMENLASTLGVRQRFSTVYVPWSVEAVEAVL